MGRRALIVGVDEYDNFQDLSGCVADAQAMCEVLATHEDGRPNFDCRVMSDPGQGAPVTRGALREKCRELFEFDGDIVFYFSGHGSSTSTGACLVTRDTTAIDPGMPMDDVFTEAGSSNARSVLVILDCCFSGEAGNPPALQSHYGLERAQLRRGVTVLAASGPTEGAREIGGHGVFTHLVLGALRGGAADVRGRVSAASIYAYVEAALGPWDQRPLYKTHASSLPAVRECIPSVPDSLLRQLPQLFSRPEAKIGMDPSFERTEPTADPGKVELFDKFKTLRDARLLRTEVGDDLYFAALDSNAVHLTPLGRFYWRLADNGVL